MRRNVIDRMALLCTLHADGPHTLRLLREAGCTTIEKLGQTRPEKVGVLLGLPPAAARRLTREAQRLVERLEPDLEQEEVTYPPAARQLEVKPPPKDFKLGDSEPSEPEPPEPAPPEAELKSRSDLDLRDRALLDRVVARWRTEDAAAHQGAVESEQAVLRQIEIQDGEVRAIAASPVESSEEEAEVVETLSPPPSAPPDVLPARICPSHLPGLDTETCEALERGGIRSLQELATCPIDELVTRSGLAFTRSRTLQFLAGRSLSQQGAVKGSVEESPTEGEELPTERLSPRERPAFLEPALGGLELVDDGGVAGPFA
jgi:hypothetical protein